MQQIIILAMCALIVQCGAAPTMPPAAVLDLEHIPEQRDHGGVIADDGSGASGLTMDTITPDYPTLPGADAFVLAPKRSHTVDDALPAHFISD